MPKKDHKKKSSRPTLIKTITLAIRTIQGTGATKRKLYSKDINSVIKSLSYYEGVKFFIILALSYPDGVDRLETLLSGLDKKSESKSEYKIDPENEKAASDPQEHKDPIDRLLLELTGQLESKSEYKTDPGMELEIDLEKKQSEKYEDRKKKFLEKINLMVICVTDSEDLIISPQFKKMLSNIWPSIRSLLNRELEVFDQKLWQLEEDNNYFNVIANKKFNYSFNANRASQKMYREAYEAIRTAIAQLKPFITDDEKTEEVEEAPRSINNILSSHFFKHSNYYKLFYTINTFQGGHCLIKKIDAVFKAKDVRELIPEQDRRLLNKQFWKSFIIARYLQAFREEFQDKKFTLYDIRDQRIANFLLLMQQAIENLGFAPSMAVSQVISRDRSNTIAISPFSKKEKKGELVIKRTDSFSHAHFSPLRRELSVFSKEELSVFSKEESPVSSKEELSVSSKEESPVFSKRALPVPPRGNRPTLPRRVLPIPPHWTMEIDQKKLPLSSISRTSSEGSSSVSLSRTSSKSSSTTERTLSDKSFSSDPDRLTLIIKLLSKTQESAKNALYGELAKDILKILYVREMFVELMNVRSNQIEILEISEAKKLRKDIVTLISNITSYISSYSNVTLTKEKSQLDKYFEKFKLWIDKIQGYDDGIQDSKIQGYIEKYSRDKKIINLIIEQLQKIESAIKIIGQSKQDFIARVNQLNASYDKLEKLIHTINFDFYTIDMIFKGILKACSEENFLVVCQKTLSEIEKHFDSAEIKDFENLLEMILKNFDIEGFDEKDFFGNNQLTVSFVKIIPEILILMSNIKKNQSNLDLYFSKTIPIPKLPDHFYSRFDCAIVDLKKNFDTYKKCYYDIIEPIFIQFVNHIFLLIKEQIKKLEASNLDVSEKLLNFSKELDLITKNMNCYLPDNTNKKIGETSLIRKTAVFNDANNFLVLTNSNFWDSSQTGSPKESRKQPDKDEKTAEQYDQDVPLSVRSGPTSSGE